MLTVLLFTAPLRCAASGFHRSPLALDVLVCQLLYDFASLGPGVCDVVVRNLLRVESE
jgi:hypothetical protein